MSRSKATNVVMNQPVGVAWGPLCVAWGPLYVAWGPQYVA